MDHEARVTLLGYVDLNGRHSPVLFLALLLIHGMRNPLELTGLTLSGFAT
jgi:hypothetical protein